MLLTEVSNYINCNKIYNLRKDNVRLNSIFTNSKNIKKNSIYAINNNLNFKKKYLQEAINQGAVGVLTNSYIKNISITQFIVGDVKNSLMIILNKLYSFSPLNSISVTGTNGKTSVAWYISQICLKNNSPIKTFGTLGYYINNIKKFNSNLTTPEYEVLYQTAFSKKKNIFNYVFEASSHAIDQKRLSNFPIDIAAITNITHDHLDYHKNLNNYRNTKFKLFNKYLKSNGFAILNDNIKNINLLKKNINKSIKIITYGSKKSNLYISSYDKKINIQFFDKNYSIKSIKYTPIEIENISCAVACCLCLNISIKNILKNLKNIDSPPGRMERVEGLNSHYRVYVDYAHTPDALKQILINKTIGNIRPNLVFGCGGSRDMEKRAIMGSIANKYANKIYVTDDNPREENPEKIRKSILNKCKKGFEFSDRKEAISSAIKDLKKNEILIIAGKGHEKFQIYEKTIKKFDDVKIAKKELSKKN